MRSCARTAWPRAICGRSRSTLVRRARRLDRGESGRHGDHELALGRIPRRGEPDGRDQGQDLLVAARGRERHSPRGQGNRHLPQLDARTTEAKAAGYDEAILLTDDGYVADGAGENVFVVEDGVVRTPPLSTSILPGITRNTVIQIAQ